MAPGAAVLSLGTPAAATAGEPVRLLLQVAPAQLSQVVDVIYRIDGGAPQRAHAAPLDLPGATQTYVAQLPALAAGQRLDFRAEMRRAGQLLATLPPQLGWQTVQAAPAPQLAPAPAAALATPASAFPALDDTGRPRFGYGLEFLGALTVKLRAEVLGLTPQGWRINFFVEQGQARGPRLVGRVRPEGGDWMCIRPDGVGEVDIKITYETPDGALILEQSGGVFDIGEEGYADVVRGVYRGAPPFYATPVYVTAHPKWQWINRLQCFGIGRVVMHDLRVECDIYAPHLKSELPLD